MLAEMQTTSPELYKKVMEESKALPNTEAVFWKVEKPGVEPSYLFGTMHLSDPRISELSQKAKDAIGQSKSVTLEVADLSDKAVGDAMAKDRNLIVYADGSKSLKTQLSDDEYKKVEKVVSKSGMPAEFAGVLKPWLVSMLLATSDCERSQLAAGAKVLDLRVAAEAQKDGMTVGGLETVEDQLAALAAVPEDQQVAMLKVGLKYIDRADDMMETLVQMYVKRQIGAAMPFQLALAAEDRRAGFGVRRVQENAARRSQRQDARRGCADARKGQRLHRRRRSASAGRDRSRGAAARARLHRHAGRVALRNVSLVCRRQGPPP